MTERNNEEKIDYNKIWTFIKTYKTPFILIFLILITAFIHSRTYNLPNTDNLARNQIEQGIKSNIRQEIINQYPNLPIIQLDAEVQKQYELFISQNNIEPYIQQQSTQYKNYFQNERGETYLLGIDPYHHYQLAEWQVNTGKQGIVIDGIVKNPLMRGRTNEVTVYWNLHSSVMAYSYKIGKVFNSELTLMQIAFIMPLLIMCIAGIVFYFIGNKIAGPIGGIVASLISTNHQSIVSRTVAGFSDTDPYHLLFPGLAILCFLYSFNYVGWKNIALLSLAGLVVSIHHTMWGGYWYTLVFMLASAGLLVLVDKKKFLTTLITLFLSTIIFSTLFCKLAGYSWTFGLTDTVKSLYKLPMDFINLKAVGTIDLWPNVMTTVAELNPSNFGNVMNGIGTNLFFVGILGLFLSLFFVWVQRRNKMLLKNNLVISGLLFVWICAGIFASITSVRFIAIVVPAFALCFAYSLPKFYDLVIRQDMVPVWSVRVLGACLVCLIVVPVLIMGNGMARQELPLMNDDWDSSLRAIRDGPSPSITFTYWDEGHMIKAIGKSSVIADGGDQGRRMFWQGKIFLSNDMDYAKAAIRMLNCGADHAPNLLEKYLNNTPRAIKLIDEIIVQTPEQAKQTLLDNGLTETQANNIINESFCETWHQYIIASGDLVSKAGAWAHYGNWDFDKAQMYYDVKPLNNEKGVNKLIKDYNLTSEQANNAYLTIQSTKADLFISPFPSYISTWASCNENVSCDINIGLGNQNGLNVYTNSAMLINNEWKFNLTFVNPLTNTVVGTEVLNESEFSFGVVYDSDNNRILICDKLLKDSLFTKLFFLNEEIEGITFLPDYSFGEIKVFEVNYDR